MLKYLCDSCETYLDKGGVRIQIKCVNGFEDYRDKIIERAKVFHLCANCFDEMPKWFTSEFKK